METTDTSENYQRGNLIVVVFYSKFLGTKDLMDVDRKDDVIGDDSVRNTSPFRFRREFRLTHTGHYTSSST
jgi:hypothetical protein